jgi:hypothetical protein
MVGGGLGLLVGVDVQIRLFGTAKAGPALWQVEVRDGGL